MTASVKLRAIQPGPMDKADLVERAARICYRSEFSSTREEQTAFLTKLAKRGHLSVFEHARYVFISNHRNPHGRYWPVRYGTQITGPNTEGDWVGDYTVSWNARNILEFLGNNPVIFGSGDTLQYDELTPGERLSHASATFEIAAISRACSHQLVRHRANSPSQESQRFVTSGDWQPIIPATIQADPESLSDFNWLMRKIKWTYKQFRKRGIPKQDARFVLPNATPTHLMVTGTFECWRGFLTQRLAKDAQWEIRDGVAQQIHAALMVIEPELFGDLSE